MNLVIFGSTGGIGKHVVEQALAVGHMVTAVARRPDAITLRHPCLEVIKGDVLDPAMVVQAVRGKDAVVSTIGIPKDAETTLYSDGLANILHAMQAASVRRVVCVSASGLDPGPLWQKLIAKPLLGAMFKGMYTDLGRMEAVVQRSSLDWTIMRPPRLSDGAHTKIYNVGVNEHLKRCFIISRADVADCIVKNLDNPAHFRAVVETAY